MRGLRGCTRILFCCGWLQRSQAFLLLAVLVAVFALSGHAGSQVLQKENQGGKTGPIVIKSKTLEADDNLKLVTFTGDVKATRDDFVIDCQKMVVHYESLPARNDNKEPGTRIKRIVATGDVKINRAKGGIATADKAVYHPQCEEIVLTNKATVKQENDLVEGDKITIYLKENRSVVESTEDRKVRAVIFPKREKR